MPRWEHRCFIRLVSEHDGAVAAALRAAGLSQDAPPQERTDVYFPADAEHGVKRRAGADSGADGGVEVKRVLSRTPVGTEALQLHRIAQRGDGPWLDVDTGIPPEPPLAAAARAALRRAPLTGAKRRWTGQLRGTRVEVSELTANAQRWLSCGAEAEGDADAAAAADTAAEACAALLSAALAEPTAPRRDATVCGYARWVADVAREAEAASAQQHS